MPRRKKTINEDRINLRIGSTMERLRRKHGYPLKTIAHKTGYSLQHISALEGGAYTFSAAVIEQLSHVFKCSTSTFLTAGYDPEEEDTQWKAVWNQLTEFDQGLLLDLARRLGSNANPQGRDDKHQQLPNKARLISLEGIDGRHLQTIGRALVARAPDKIAYCPHEYESSLWHYMIEHFAKIDAERATHRALERTMLFACERLFRHSEQIAPALLDGKTVVAPYFSMASSVFQQVEGVGDRRLSDLVEALLPRPDTTIVIHSSARSAARKAVARIPAMEQFYSPYEGSQFASAKRFYELTVQAFKERGRRVSEFYVVSRSLDETIDAIYRRILRESHR